LPSGAVSAQNRPQILLKTQFFYAHTCPQDWRTLTKLRVAKQLKLPAVLTIPEVDQLIDAIRKPAMKCFFWTVYSLGLRLQEALFLQVGDIDAGRMLVHVRRGKGHKDRLVPLVPRTLDVLRRHWATHRNPCWLFPREGRNHQQSCTAQDPMDATTVQDCIRKVVDELQWSKRGVSTHTLRHSYATHLLEAEVNLRQIQKSVVPSLAMNEGVTEVPLPRRGCRAQPRVASLRAHPGSAAARVPFTPKGLHKRQTMDCLTPSG